MRLPRIVAALAAVVASLPGSAAILYKSVGPNGVIQFSDHPPENAQVVAAIPLDRASSPAGVPPLVATAPDPNAPQSATDALVENASARLDLAEHALAGARRPAWSEPDLLRIAAPRLTRADRERIAWYEKDVRRARLALADAMRRKVKADMAATLTASNDWQPFRPTDRR